MKKRSTIEETQTWIFLALPTLLIIVIYGTTQVTNANATATNITTNTQLKRYTDPAGFFTLQYPADWTVNHTPSNKVR